MNLFIEQLDPYNQIHLTAIEDIMEEIKKCNAIRYPSYRTAAKIQILHKKLHSKYILDKFKFKLTITNLLLCYSAICTA